MNTRSTTPHLLAIALLAVLALPASAGGVYRSVDADGGILFSDTPPPPEAGLVMQGRTSSPPGVGMPYYETAETDGTVSRANVQLDLAEHALALARQALPSPRDGFRLVAARMNRGDGERVAFYNKDVQTARRQLTDSLRNRQSALELAVR